MTKGRLATAGLVVCWARLNFAFPSSLQDTTTWTARIEVDPVRPVE